MVRGTCFSGTARRLRRRPRRKSFQTELPRLVSRTFARGEVSAGAYVGVNREVGCPGWTRITSDRGRDGHGLRAADAAMDSAGGLWAWAGQRSRWVRILRMTRCGNQEISQEIRVSHEIVAYLPRRISLTIPSKRLRKPRSFSIRSSRAATPRTSVEGSRWR